MTFHRNHIVCIIFDHTVKPILLYGSEIWGTFNPTSAKFRNGISFDKIFNNIEPEKLHLKFAKFVLGIQRKRSNFAVMSELGRFPYYIDIVKASLKYWHRLENVNKNSLLSDALECSKSLSQTSNSWYNTIQQYSNILGVHVPLNSFIHMKLASFNTKLSKLLKDKYLHEWYSAKQSLSVGKLDTYTRTKSNFGFEKYLSSLHFNHRKDLIFFFFFLIWVLRPFQEYFTYIEPIVHRRWAKTGEPGEKPPDHP